MTSISVAVIGLGRMGNRHAQAVMQSGRCRLDYVVDTNEASLSAFSCQRERFLSKFSPTHRPDLAIVATPSVNHAAAAGYLLSLGCTVLVEKPITLSVASAKHLRGPIFVSHTERYKPVVQHVAERIESVTGWYSNRVALVEPDDSVSGGPLFDLAVHDFDLYHLLSGNSVVPIESTRNRVLCRDAEFSFGYGTPRANALIDTSTLSFLAGSYRIHVDFRQNDWSVQGKQMVTGGHVSYTSFQDGISAQLHDVVSYMDTGRKPKFLCSKEDALEAVRSAEMAMTLNERKPEEGSQVVEK